jgi:hypothetical protein
MPKNRKKPAVPNQSRRTPLSKPMLLPPTAVSVRKLVLRHHIALAAFHAGKGNGSLLAELVKALYLAWYLQVAGFGAADRELYLEAERLLDHAARNAHKDIWFIEAADSVSISRLLNLCEQQLLSAPIYAVGEARARLSHFSKSNKRSPW